MKTTKRQFGFSQKLLILALLAAIGPVHAADDDDDEEDAVIAKLLNPTSSVSIGAGTVTGNSLDRTVFSQFNGLRENDNNLLLNVEIRKLDKETGTWTEIIGRDLGLDSREIKVERENQGNYEIFATYLR